jgi:NAD+ synthase
VAATNFKQRVRKMLEYFHADRLHYAVIGTPNRLEYDLGFFVKGGDGLADLKPIAHLYKTQVYGLAGHLGVPEAITGRPPTTDTFPMPQGQEEFFFAVPLPMLDRILHGMNSGLTPAAIAEETGEDTRRVESIVRQVERKRSSSRYLHLPALLAQSAEGG